MIRQWQEKAFDFLNKIPGHQWPNVISKSSTNKKQELIALAKSGAKRPSQKSPLGGVLSNYTSKSSSSYDPDFDKEIRTLRPDWFRL
jgi:hypothetical protein